MGGGGGGCISCAEAPWKVLWQGDKKSHKEGPSVRLRAGTLRATDWVLLW